MSLYRPLDPNRHEIRLLHLLPESPSEGGFDSPINCTLTYADLDSPSLPAYEALTYFWGDPSDTRPITLDSSFPVSITANLCLALRHLRLPFSPRTLWVDALCINQSDTAERSHQVSLMRDVYQRCARDIAWLGPLADSDDFAPDYLGDSDGKTEIAYAEHVGAGMELLRRMRLRDLADASLAGNPGLGSMLGGEEHHELDYRQVDALRAIFQRPQIWRRVWVMQELSCAREVTLVYAREELDWRVVSGFLDNRAYADAFHMPQGHGTSSPVTMGLMTAVLAVEHQRGVMREGYRAGLLDVLARFKNVHSTDPRDRVYGLLGLVTEEHSVRVDYGKKVGDAFAEVAVYLINSLGNLDIICQNPWAKDKHTPGLASWVPDFADEEYSNRDASTGFARLLFAQRSIFAAGREKCETPARAEVRDGRWKIRARGAVIGKLGKVLHDECHDEKIRDSSYGPLLLPRKWMLLYFGTELLDAPEEKRKLETFWRTLLMDCESYPIRRLNDEVVEEVRPDWEFHLRYDGPDDPNEAKEEDREMLQEGWWKFGKGRHMWYRNRDEWTFCVSDQGLYMMVRRGAMEGDLIAVLDGGKVPVILREVPDRAGRETEYVVVCVAYVHGFMDGEAVEMCEAGELTEQEFLIT
ncbi:HET-domain-containing protein [Coniochaeta hoffmannii]|uniref:HET-domain-containing protein n=1 Tax=Coniochaeta hoffmannii TaxID=91930 RepID=A0AA38VLS8_9PEZI|nr:HET-domain-containing protein [Coniochaeta hoffmannii]